jgi:hypothetical protein
MSQPFAAEHERGPSCEVELARERTLSLPSAVSNLFAMGALFPAPTAEVSKLLPSRRLRPVELYPGTALVGFTAFEYGKVQGLSPFAEAGVAVPVRHEPRVEVPLLPVIAPRFFGDAGYYFHRLAVDSPAAAELGDKLYGQRRLLADIRFREQPFWRRCDVEVEGKLVFSLELRKLRTRAMQLGTRLYSLRDGHIAGTPMPARGEVGLSRGGRSKGRLDLGNHYIADELRALDLGRDPVATLYAPDLESLLAAPDRTLPA